MQLQILNAEHGITAYEQARMALKLLINYGKKKDYEALKLKKDREHVSRKNAVIHERLNSGQSRKDEQQATQKDEDLKSLLESIRSGDARRTKKILTI